jgi:hypothetical protein
VLAENLVLLRHHWRAADFANAGGEVAVPEQRELLHERPPTVHHAVNPVGADILYLVEVQKASDQMVELSEAVFHSMEFHKLDDTALIPGIEPGFDFARCGAEAGSAE